MCECPPTLLVRTSATKECSKEAAEKGEASTRSSVRPSAARCCRSDHSGIQSAGQPRYAIEPSTAAAGHTCLLGVRRLVSVSTKTTNAEKTMVISMKDARMMEW